MTAFTIGCHCMLSRQPDGLVTDAQVQAAYHMKAVSCLAVWDKCLEQVTLRMRCLTLAPGAHSLYQMPVFPSCSPRLSP